MLAHDYDGRNVDGWMISEKMDGMRAYWTGAVLLSRNMKDIHAPNWWTQAYMPKGIKLEGELRATNFQETMSICRRKIPDDRWKNVRFYAFDSPYSLLPFHKVYAELRRLSENHGFVCLEQTVGNLDERFEAAEEGVMLRDPNSIWVPTRSYKLLKYKKVETTTVEILSVDTGLGKFSGLAGTLRVREGNVVFDVGGLGKPLNFFQPKQLIEIEFRGRTLKGVPREGRYLRHV